MDKLSSAAFDVLCVFSALSAVIFAVRLHSGASQISQPGSRSVVSGLRTIGFSAVWLLPTVLLCLLLLH